MPGNKTIWAVAGGGGTGKSTITANFGCVLAARGREVVLVDADPRGAGLYACFGIKRAAIGLDDFIEGRFQRLEEAAIDTEVKGLRLISGAGGDLGAADRALVEKLGLIEQIRKLNADHIIVDLGADSSRDTLDFFAIANEGIVVLVPEPAAIQSAYVFLKSFVYRRLVRLFSDNHHISEVMREATDARGQNSVKTFSDLCERLSREDRQSSERALSEIKSFRPRVILNMAASSEDLKAVDAFRSALSTFLSLETVFAGVIAARQSIGSAAGRMRPFMLDESAEDARRDMAAVAANLLGEERIDEPAPTTAPRPAAREVFGFNDNVSHMGAVYHVQTEAQGGEHPSVETIIYRGGRIFFSKKTPTDEISGMTVRDFAARQHKAAMAAIKMNKITFQG